MRISDKASEVLSQGRAGGSLKADLLPNGNPIYDEDPSTTMKVAVATFVILPTLALVLFVPVSSRLGFGPSWLDIGMLVVMYCITCAGVGAGFHRYFTHGSYKATRGLKIALAICGSLALQGPLIQWVADHHRHHAFSDREGDPHSPWRFGTRARDVAKGLAYAHMGWLFDRDLSNRETFAQYLMNDKDLKIIDRLFPLFVVLSLGMPAMVGGLVTWSWHGALTAFIWAGIVRVGILHHVTWSINSICHTFGEETFKTRDKSRNVWWMAILSFGESWHNLHHAKPKYARHGVDPGQIDINARIIWILEKCGRATEVRWPSQKALFESRVKAA